MIRHLKKFLYLSKCQKQTSFCNTYNQFKKIVTYQLTRLNFHENYSPSCDCSENCVSCVSVLLDLFYNHNQTRMTSAENQHIISRYFGEVITIQEETWDDFYGGNISYITKTVFSLINIYLSAFISPPSILNFFANLFLKSVSAIFFIQNYKYFFLKIFPVQYENIFRNQRKKILIR